MFTKLFRLSSLTGLMLALVWAGCSIDAPVSPDTASDTGKLSAGTDDDQGMEVQPVFRRNMGNGRFLTVFVDHAHPERHNARPGPAPSCSDPNTNQAYLELGVEWANLGLALEYHTYGQPRGLATADVRDALAASVAAWENASGSDLANLNNNNGNRGPVADGVNVVGWRKLIPQTVLAATWIWDDGNGNIIEADVFYNTSQKWSVNGAINPGSTACGENFDVQAIGTHEFGHFFGLGHVSSDGNGGNGNENDATMAPTAAKAELQKQTLTPGDDAGINAVKAG
ncbi:MAG: hypothetical protein FJY67_07245 [Calditrichaeota bacterium]|nr:hypothetical protein [Calditrichota bacterium]